MDLAEIKRLALAAREFTTEVGGDNRRVVRLRIPTAHEAAVAAARSGLVGVVDDKAAMVLLQRAFLLGGVVGWEGIRYGDVLPDLPGDQAGQLLPHAPAAVELVLDAQPEWAAHLGRLLVARMAERGQQREAAEKNSAP